MRVEAEGPGHIPGDGFFLSLLRGKIILPRFHVALTEQCSPSLQKDMKGMCKDPNPPGPAPGARGKLPSAQEQRPGKQGEALGSSSLVGMPEWRHQHQAPGPATARLTSGNIFPVFSRLSLDLIFLKSFQSQVS